MGIFSLFDPSTDGTHGRSGPRSGGMRRKTACRPRLRLKGDASAAGDGHTTGASLGVVAIPAGSRPAALLGSPETLARIASPASILGSSRLGSANRGS